MTEIEKMNLLKEEIQAEWIQYIPKEILANVWTKHFWIYESTASDWHEENYD